MVGLYPGPCFARAASDPALWVRHEFTPMPGGTVPNTQQSTDAIVLLKADHKEIRKTFADFEKAGDGAEKTKQRLVDKIIELLTVHTYIENEVMYPRVRAPLPDLEDALRETY